VRTNPKKAISATNLAVIFEGFLDLPKTPPTTPYIIPNSPITNKSKGEIEKIQPAS
jgi:hypothetical protein